MVVKGEAEMSNRQTHYLKLWLGLKDETIAQVINREEFMILKGETSHDLWNCNYLNGKTATVITCAIGWEVTRMQAIQFATNYVTGRTVENKIDMSLCGSLSSRLRKPPVTNRGVTES